MVGKILNHSSPECFELDKFGGSIITESVFSINGLGRLALEILGADIPTVQILVFVFAY